jgi:hypothetical protein
MMFLWTPNLLRPIVAGLVVLLGVMFLKRKKIKRIILPESDEFDTPVAPV